MSRLLSALTLACSVAVVAPALAQNAAKVAGTDAKFVHDAALGGMTEVELGKAADKNAVSPQVKTFGKHMVDDHSKANDELAALAKSKGVDAPASLDAEHKKAVDKLSGMSGAAFDKAFMTQMVTDHKKTVALFEKAASGSKDPDIKAFASKTLPTLKEHLKMAEETRKSSAS